MSFSVITLPPHPKLSNIHTKASPLLLPPEPELINAWLDDNVTDPVIFDDLLKPRIPVDLIAQQIDKPSSYNSIAEAFEIRSD
ncbi:hypothetical protein [Rheinheimera salexigens]|uniref:Uncharacterized protein n=1 Tax=Rheinheimera salexigens TaxID=1628148 RepID=A0A1E7Q651_9GAMM|nr:hypothetical protein [Rheinheimera salexigens]OEY69655.1 hypothetical protein BI198_08860 [Rheinheimera salexigens]